MNLILMLSSNMIGDSDDETNFRHKLLLTNRQVAHLRKAFANYLSTDIKLSKISWQTFRSITENRIAINKKCNSNIS